MNVIQWTNFGGTENPHSWRGRRAAAAKELASLELASGFWFCQIAVKIGRKPSHLKTQGMKILFSLSRGKKREIQILFQ